MADFLLRFRIGNDRTGIHFRARAGHSEHTAEGHDRTGRFFKADKVFIPRIFVAVDRNGYGLRVVTDRTAADGQEEIRLMAAGNFNTFV